MTTPDRFDWMERHYSLYKNIYAALRRLRLPHKALVTWFDALAVKQSDILSARERGNL